jgi:Protein of unknown function (DUF3017)
VNIRAVARAHWPIVAVGATFALAFLLVALSFWRRGALLIGVGVALAAVLRLVLTEAQAGLLVVRSKRIDVTMTAAVAAVVLFTAWTIDPLGTS